METGKLIMITLVSWLEKSTKKRALLSLFNLDSFLEKYQIYYIIQVKINMQKLSVLCVKNIDQP